MMNMGTAGRPESLGHFGTKAAMLSLFRTAIPRGAIWGILREPQHDGCNGGPLVVNLTAGVTEVHVERPYKPGGFIPDLTLQRPAPHLPTFIEVEVSSPASKRKVDYCRRHGINLLTAYGRAPVDNNATVRLLKLGVEQCRSSVKYVVGTRTVAREDLLTMCMLHLYFIEDLEVRFGDATTGEHGDPIRYSRKALDADASIREVINRVEFQNGADGPRVSPERADAYDLSSVFWYPRRWGLRPRPDAYRRA